MQDKKQWRIIMEQLKPEQVEEYICDLGSCPPTRVSDNVLVFQSICHNSQSKKLYYYIDSCNFYCFKESEHFNIFSLTMHCLGLDFKEAYKYVCNYFGISIYGGDNFLTEGFGNSYVKQDWEIFDRYSEDRIAISPPCDKIYNNNIINVYSKLYYDGWLKDNITRNSMQKFEIRYNITDNCIVIPHYNVDEKLVGIRGRFLDEYSYAKYMPLTIEKITYNHTLTNHLYGLWKNKDTIQKLEKVLITEGEKSVMQAESYFPDNNFVVACCGQNISNAHIKLLVDLGVREVQLGFDSDFYKIGFNEDYLKYRKSILRKAKKLIPYFRVYNIGAYDSKTIYYKSSPTDMGKAILLDMMAHKEWLYEEKIAEELEEIEKKLKELR